MYIQQPYKYAVPLTYDFKSNIEQNDTRFFNISRTELDRFYEISKRYELDIYGDLEGFDQSFMSEYEKQEIKDVMSNINSKFVFSGLPTSGKSTLSNLIHNATGKKITSYDLIKEMKKGKLCEKFNITKNEFKINFNVLMKGLFNGTYREWLTEIFKESVEQSIENDTLLDIGGYNLLREKEHLFLRKNNIIIIYIEIGKENWIAKSTNLINQRSEFNEIYKNDITSNKQIYAQFCKDAYSIKGEEIKNKSDIIIEKENLTPYKLLKKSLLKLSNYVNK